MRGATRTCRPSGSASRTATSAGLGRHGDQASGCDQRGRLVSHLRLRALEHAASIRSRWRRCGRTCLLERADARRCGSPTTSVVPHAVARLHAARAAWYERVRDSRRAATSADSYPSMRAAAGLQASSSVRPGGHRHAERGTARRSSSSPTASAGACAMWPSPSPSDREARAARSSRRRRHPRPAAPGIGAVARRAGGSSSPGPRSV